MRTPPLKVSPLLLEAFDLLHTDPAPFVSWLDDVRPVGWVRQLGCELQLPFTADVKVVAMRYWNSSCDVEVLTRWSRMMSGADIVSIVAKAAPHVFAATIMGKALHTVASTEFLLSPYNVVLKAVRLERPPRLIFDVRALAVPFQAPR